MDENENSVADGLAAIRERMKAGFRPGISQTMQFDLVEAGDGFSVFESIPGAHLFNPLGSVHGGFAATLLDSACGIAVHTRMKAGQSYTTLELKVSYLKTITAETGPMRAEGKVISMGRRVAFTEARLTDAAGKVYATATSTLLVITP
jgi:uncharacterized protein (TIGR00369 family)